MAQCGIYLYKDKKTGENLYVGQSIQIDRRHIEHMRGSSCHSGSLFEKEAAKRGWENLELVVLEDNLPRRSLNKKENEWYLTLKPLYNAVVPTPRRRWSEICEILKQRPEFIAWREKLTRATPHDMITDTE